MENIVLTKAIRWETENSTGFVFGKEYFDKHMLKQFSQRGVSTNSAKLTKGFVDQYYNFYISEEEAIKKLERDCNCIEEV